MFSLVFTRRFTMAHRLRHNSPKCAVPHGHNELVRVKLEATDPRRLDGLTNVVEVFDDAKRRWHSWIDNHVDHALQLGDRDPLLDYFTLNEPDLVPRIMVLPGDPTTEILAACFMAKLNTFLNAEGGHLHCAEIVIEETPTNTVMLSGDPTEVLPEIVSEARWWWRADDSINNLQQADHDGKEAPSVSVATNPLANRANSENTTVAAE
jgi:6-pyruvoyltetrahydropterin/6-carboxytetrahydropterin synthase